MFNPEDFADKDSNKKVPEKPIAKAPGIYYAAPKEAGGEKQHSSNFTSFTSKTNKSTLEKLKKVKHIKITQKDTAMRIGVGLAVVTGGIFIGTLVLHPTPKHILNSKLPTIQNQQAKPQAVLGVIDSVKKHTSLPTDEDPSVATVTDVSKLQNQPFFKDAETGDKVLIYPKAHKAILYRSSTDTIINEAPVEVENEQTSTASGAPIPTSNPDALHIKY